MQATVLCIGDPHIQVSNIPETDLLIERLINFSDKNMKVDQGRPNQCWMNQHQIRKGMHLYEIQIHKHQD